MQRFLWKVIPLLLLVVGYTTVANALTPEISVSPGSEQADGTQLPYIAHFEISPSTPFTVFEIESGRIPATLSWHTLAVTAPYSLALEFYYLNRWEPVVPATQSPLPPAGSQPIFLHHPANFGPPTYRLVIRDDTGSTIDERYVVIPYAPSTLPPQVSSFTADVTNLTEAQLRQGRARVTVSWEVANRPPMTNLVFEQLRTDGTAFSIELPRPFAWIPSKGQGTIAPVMPEGEPLLRLRVRLINTLDRLTIHERNLTIPIGATAVNVPTIHQFTVEPAEIERGQAVTVVWSVSGADVVLVGQIDPDGAYIRPEHPLPPDGSQSFTPFAFDFYSAGFFIYAGDNQGNGITSTTTVAVHCPYSYFFPLLPELENTCPLAAVAEVPAAHQQFERGDMLWRSDRTEIIALYSDGTYERFADTYVEDEEIDYPADLEEPPFEDALPIRGFGKVWATNPTVRVKLGWATGHEIGFNLTTQAVADGKLGRAFAAEYIVMPNSQLLGLYPDNSWRLIEIEAP